MLPGSARPPIGHSASSGICIRSDDTALNRQFGPQTNVIYAQYQRGPRKLKRDDKMGEIQKGGCLCGKSRYQFSGEPKFSIQCYCRDCQHISGGGHMPQFTVSADSHQHSGPIKACRQLSDSGNDLVFSFCAECGSPLFKTTSMAPDLVFINAGSLDDPANFVSGNNVFESSRQPWDHG